MKSMNRNNQYYGESDIENYSERRERVWIL